MRRTTSLLRSLAAALTVCWVAACGGSSSTNTSTKATTSAATTSASTSTQSTTASSGSGSTSAVTSGPVRATLHGENHSPKVNKNWTYTVTATDAAGHPLAGTVLTEFVFSGQVVGRETPPTHPLKNGRLEDVVQFPAQAVGIPLTFQTVVATRLGSVALGWPVKVGS